MLSKNAVFFLDLKVQMTDKRISTISNSLFKQRLVLYTENFLNYYLDILLKACGKTIQCSSCFLLYFNRLCQ